MNTQQDRVPVKLLREMDVPFKQFYWLKVIAQSRPVLTDF